MFMLTRTHKRKVEGLRHTNRTLKEWLKHERTQRLKLIEENCRLIDSLQIIAQGCYEKDNINIPINPRQVAYQTLKFEKEKKNEKSSTSL